MADSSVNITAGSGTAVDTRTEDTNGNHRQVIIIGDPSSNAGVATVSAADGLLVNLGSNNDVTVTGSVTANAGTNLNTSSLALESGGNLAAAATSLGLLDNIVSGNEAQVDVVGALPAGDNNIGNVDIASALPAGTNNIGDVDVLTIPGIVGTVADDATTPGAPVMVGGSAKESDGTDPGSVSAEDDVVRAIFDRNRRQYVNTFHPNLWSASENHSSAQTNNELKAAPGAGLSLYVTDVIISNGATAGDIKLVRDTSGTPVDILENLYVAVNGGAVINFTTPIRLPANINLGFTSTTVTTHSITVNGFTAP